MIKSLKEKKRLMSMIWKKININKYEKLKGYEIHILSFK